MKNSNFFLNTYSLGIERAKIQWCEKPNVRGTLSRGHPPCCKVVRLARVPYYARPRLTPFLSVHVSLGSGSIRRALADVSPSLPPLGIKPANGRKKWSHDNARAPFSSRCIHCPLRCNPLGHPLTPSTPRLSPRLAPFPCRRHIRLLAFLFP